MTTNLTYGIIFMVLLVLELFYFRIADKCNIIDKPNERSSHSTIVLRGGGIIFMLGLWIWAAFFGWGYPWFLAAVTLIAGVSLVDDIRSLPDSVRLVAQFVAMGLMFYQLDMLHWEMWWIVFLALIVCVGASNIINFMDGINGITGGYTLASLIPLYVLNKEMGFVEESLVVTVILADVVFCLFNFRQKGKAKCFAGDVGSIGIAFILLFMIGRLVMQTEDVTYLIFLLVYGVDGCLTIIHRIMLHENLGEAHRKHAYQLMANELKMGHVKVSLLYMTLQLAISLGFVFLVPDTLLAHWAYLIIALLVLAMAYTVFMKRYYPLHEEYLASLKNKTNGMDIIEINDNLLAALHGQAAASERKRMNYDLRTTAEDDSQRMLNALEVGTKVPIHRHLETSETTVCLQGCMDVVFYDLRPNEDCGGPFMGDFGTVIADGMEANVFERYRVRLCPREGKYGVQIPLGAWHSVEVYEPSTIVEAKDGRYGRRERDR